LRAHRALIAGHPLSFSRMKFGSSGSPSDNCDGLVLQRKWYVALILCRIKPTNQQTEANLLWLFYSAN